ncbi:bifunctional lysylphosphatidylglycerol flippase/synthetase MprF [Corynebacterium qintianiae]|uniref:bifunctional lysylphosphatidylglycerol flippase/synthetase MprF n=1 Tax=Corynebacterium qintianiae TaxID=2709392 RepID=UPI0020180727|nr:phosphatidylglycerol lysyltransferase domain-containing protein [Corynebacterium qintianiae]
MTSAPSGAAESDRERARAILTRGTGDHLAWMGLWEGNRFFFMGGDTGYVAFRVSRNVAVTLGGPVRTEESTRDEIADAFEEFAAEQGWRVAWYSVSEDFARAGFRTIHVAEESLLLTDNLEFKGKRFQNIRTARNRAAKEGVRAVWTTWADLDVEMREKIVALSEQWVADKALPEMGFTLGSVDELAVDGTMLLLAVGEDGHLHGVTSWLPVYECGELAGYTLDFMRRDTDGFRPTVEFLLAEAAAIAGAEGLKWVSLSGAPLARSGEPESLLEVLLDRAGASIEPLYGFRSLAASKYKFHPTHSGWYLAYDDELALGAIAFAVVSCYLPTMKPSDYAGVVKEFLATRQPADRGAPPSPAAAPTPHP